MTAQGTTVTINLDLATVIHQTITLKDFPWAIASTITVIGIRAQSCAYRTSKVVVLEHEHSQISQQG